MAGSGSIRRPCQPFSDYALATSCGECARSLFSLHGTRMSEVIGFACDWRLSHPGESTKMVGWYRYRAQVAANRASSECTLLGNLPYCRFCPGFHLAALRSWATAIRTRKHVFRVSEKSASSCENVAIWVIDNGVPCPIQIVLATQTTHTMYVFHSTSTSQSQSFSPVISGPPPLARACSEPAQQRRLLPCGQAKLSDSVTSREVVRPRGGRSPMP
jgi:hypothetical protein